MKIIVTGGAGFIGSAVCRQIVSETEHAVINVDCLTYAANLHSLDSVAASDRYSFRQLNICDSAAIGELFANENPDAVLHLAAESHVDRSITGPAQFIDTNIVGTYTLLEAARNWWDGQAADKRAGFKFVHVSTDEVYGALGSDGVFTEDTPYDPSSPYSASKAASDHLAMAWHRTFGLPVVISNCSNNYGPYQFPEKLIPLMIINALHEEDLPVYGQGENVRDWLYVNDHADALLKIVEKGVSGERYNIGSRSEQNNLDVVHAICDHLDRVRPRSGSAPYRDLIRFVTDRPGHDFRYAIDPQKIETELGWTSNIDFSDGIQRTVDWYLANEAWWRPIRETVYAGSRLGLAPKEAV